MAVVAVKLGRDNTNNIGIYLRQRLVEAQHQAEEMKNRLHQENKVAIVGQLVATTLHEINNPLSVVDNVLYLLKQREPTDEQRQLIEMALDEMKRASSIVHNTLLFTREAHDPVFLKVRDILSGVIELYEPRTRREQIKVNIDIPLEVIMVQGWPGQLRQLFANIFRNAIEASGPKGEIFVRLHGRRHHTSEKFGIRVLIADSGPGISAEARRHIGQPFYTTKGEGGTGLGMWIASEIVAKHGGFLKVHNRPRGGAVFSIFLPMRLAVQEEVAA